MKAACTTFHNPPGNPKVLPQLNQKDYQSLVRGVKSICVDSASNEILSAEMLRRADLRSSVATMDALCPNLRFVIRDAAHASRRVYGRPAASDPVLRNLTYKFALGKTSMPQRIQHSRQFRKVLTKFIKAQPQHAQSKVSNLRCAKHRLESVQKPTGRTCLYYIPMLQTSVEIARTQLGRDVGKDAVQWLTDLNDRGQTSLGVGMLSDAMDEGMRFTRFLDSEISDKARIHNECSAFLSRIDALFTGRGCLQSGFTKLMMDQYCQPVLCALPQVTFELGHSGGIADDAIDSLLRRMSIWVGLCKLAVQAEFPDYSLTSSMAILDVTSSLAITGRPRVDTDKEFMQRAATRMSQAFGVHADNLVQELSFWCPRAASLAQQHGLTNSQDAWRMLVQQQREVVPSKRPFSIGLLREVLEQCFGTCLATSGVESAFSIHRREWTPQRDSASSDSEAYVTTLMLDLPRHMPKMHEYDDKLVAEARLVWAQVYPPPRTHVVPRADRGIPRLQSRQLGTERAFIKERRDAADALLRPSSNTLLTDNIDVTQFPEWSETHAKEAAFAKDKCAARKLQAYQERVLTVDERDNDTCLAAKLKAQQAQQVKDQRKRENNALKHRMHAEGGLAAKPDEFWMLMQTVQVYVSDSCASRRVNKYYSKYNHAIVADAFYDFNLYPNCCWRHRILTSFKARAPGAQIADDICNAHVAIVGNSRVPSAVRWAAALKGMFLVTEKLNSGIVKKFKPAFNIPGQIFVTEALKRDYANWYAFVNGLMKSHGKCKWKWVPTEHEYKTMYARYQSSRNTALVVALGTSAEIKGRTSCFHGNKHVYNLAEFLCKIEALDIEKSICWPSRC